MPELDPDIIPAVLSALSVFFAALTVSWPYIMQDDLASRIDKLEAERERIRQREKMATGSGGRLFSRPRPIYQRIVDLLKLDRWLEDEKITLRLEMAGYRGQAPIISYLAARVILPLIVFPISFFYLGVLFPSFVPFYGNIALSCIIAVIAFFLPDIFLKNRIMKRQKSINRAWPETLDLLLISVEAGMSIEGAFKKVSQEVASQSQDVAEELTMTTAELSFLQDRKQAFINLGRRVGTENVRAVVTSLIQAERYGTPMGSALRVMAQENRDMRMAAAEKKAAALPPKLTVPMILFFLPVLFAVIMTPAIIEILEM